MTLKATNHNLKVIYQRTIGKGRDPSSGRRISEDTGVSDF